MFSDPTSPEFYDKLKDFANADPNPIKYLGIDPGKSNGVCGYDAKYYLQFMLTVAEKDMSKFLRCFEQVDTCVVEDYLLYPNKAAQQYYSDLITPRVIGRIEAWAELFDTKVVKQGASIKETGYKWIGHKKPSKADPTNHQKDAHVHFIYWGVKNGKIDPRTLLKRGSNG